MANTAKTAQDTVGNVAEAAKGAIDSGAHLAKSAAQAAGQTADRATSAVGGGVESLGHTIREHAPQSGVLGAAASTTASALENAGSYIREEGLSGMMEDVTETIKRNPMAAMLIAVAVGFLLARVTRS